MVKKCIVCNQEAVYRIKDTADFYCQDCAEENFADLSLLIRLEEEAQRLKEMGKKRLEEELQKEVSRDEDRTD